MRAGAFMDMHDGVLVGRMFSACAAHWYALLPPVLKLTCDC